MPLNDHDLEKDILADIVVESSFDEVRVGVVDSDDVGSSVVVEVCEVERECDSVVECDKETSNDTERLCVDVGSDDFVLVVVCDTVRLDEGDSDWVDIADVDADCDARFDAVVERVTLYVVDRCCVSE